MGSKRSVLGMVFLVVFLDIVGFSVLFPLFPEMLDHYLGREGSDSAIARLVAWLEEFAGDDENAVATLFGGILGSVYSLLQFLFAPFWGAYSDRNGRRSTLLLTLTGTAVAYVLWTFAGAFAVLIGSRLLAGIMAGNISTASAVVGDTTDAQSRAKGMGILGMGIGLGFVVGPAIGAFSAWASDAMGLFQETSSEGAFALNPFSLAALLSLSLATVNLVWVARRFPETHPAENRGRGGHGPSLQPFKAMKQIDAPGVARTSWVYFAYLLAFAAMEFTLTFLARERFEYTAVEQGTMFVFVGLLIAFTQGGLVRRMAPKYGEKKLAMAGLVLTFPGFALVGLGESEGLLYAGLACMAIGSGLTMPTLSALVSRYTPADRQGLALGAFRSAGSMSRALGPILGGILYWKFAKEAPYLTAAAFLVIPIALALRLPDPPSGPQEASGEAA